MLSYSIHNNMNIKSLLNVAGLLLATLLVFYLLLFTVNFGASATFNPGVCPDSGGWVKVDGLSGLHYEFNVPAGYTVTDNCYKAGDFVVYGTGSNVVSGVFNSPQGAVCIAPGIPHNGCNYLDLSHASFLLVELSTPPDDPPVCEWTQWSECSAPCGGGIHDRYCGDEREWEVCNTQACPCPEVPEFPQCPLGYAGDVAHFDRYASNPHQIVGGPLLFGGDDVYSLENGNFLQCFCPDEGTEGIQTNWWRTDEILDGWFREFGTQWNLGDYWYLAQNSSFICDSGNTGGNDPTSTPTPTPSPTPTGSQSSGGSSSGSSSSDTGNNNQEQVLGTTTLAATGSVADHLIVLGLVLILSSIYGVQKIQEINKI